MKRKPDRRATRKGAPSVERRRRSDRRRSDRLVVDLKVDFKTDDMFLYAYITDLSSLGVFVLTANPHPVGSRLQLRFELPESAAPLEAEGEVRWVRARSTRKDAPEPGMGVQFTHISTALTERLSSLIKRVIYFEAETGA